MGVSNCKGVGLWRFCMLQSTSKDLCSNFIYFTHFFGVASLPLKQLYDCLGASYTLLRRWVIIFLNVIIFSHLVSCNCNISEWIGSNTMNVQSALWILMSWCFSTRERERERLSLSAFLRTEDIGVHIVHASAPGHQQQQCWVCIHAFPVIYRSTKSHIYINIQLKTKQNNFLNSYNWWCLKNK